MRRIGLLVEYDGGAYHGSQWQPRQSTIEGRMREAVFALTGERARVVSQGRTDTGVHALGQVIAIDTATEHRPGVFVKGLNRFLPDDIAVKDASELPDGFDVRRRARGRVYRYLVYEAETPSPLRRRWAWVCGTRLDVEAMEDAAHELLGEHDFASFASPPDRPINTVRTMRKAAVRRKQHMIDFVFEATAFLPHQIRRTMGSLVRIGQGRMSVTQFRALLDTPVLATAEPVAPPQGLYLRQVQYEPPLFLPVGSQVGEG